MILQVFTTTAPTAVQRWMEGKSMNDTGRVIVCVTALICTTIAAMYFNSMGVLWWLE